MHTIKQNIYFSFNGISCRDFGLVSVNLDSGMFEEQMVHDREIVETKIRGNDTPLFHSLDDSPREFELNLAFEEKWEDKTMNDIIDWLFIDRYGELVFENNPNRIYHCIPVGSSNITHTGFKEGFFSITMRMKSSKIHSPVITTSKYDFSSNLTSGKTIPIFNSGHENIYPELSIQKVGNGDVTITIDNKVLKIKDLTNLEKIYLNTEKEIIETDLLGVYRYDNLDGECSDIFLKKGNNNINIKGNCTVQLRYVLKYKF